jgi:hypothetical protein
MVFGKTPAANRSLTEQFTSRHVRKKYLLLTDRVVPQRKFAVKIALVRVGEKYASRPLPAGGETAETKFRPCRIQKSEAGSPNGGWLPPHCRSSSRAEYCWPRRTPQTGRRKIVQSHYFPQPPDFPISRTEPAYLKTVWLRIG